MRRFESSYLALAYLAPLAGARAQEALAPLPGAAITSSDPAIAERYRRIDAQVDGWESEVFQDAAGAQLDALGKLIAHPQNIDEARCAKVVAADWRSPALRPKTLEVAFADANLEVRRGVSAPEVFEGVEGFTQSLRELASGFEGAKEAYIKFKIVGVELGDAVAKTRCYLSANARHGDRSLQRDALWICTWRLGAEGAPPLLLAVETSGHQETTSRVGVPALFDDVTESALGATRAWRDQLRLGVDHWCAALDVQLGISTIGHEGFALGDADGDGLEDLYLCAPGGLPNRLLLANADGSLRDAPANCGVDFLEASRAALFADLDGDGDQDLVTSLADQLLFLENDGAAHFALKTRVTAGPSASLAIADVDDDQDLDVYVCGYVLSDSEDRVPLPYDDANNGLPNTLFENQADWKFVDRTRERGLDQNNRRFSFAAAFEDFDDDGDQDLYVANDFGRNNLYRNDGGHFVDIAAAAGVEDIAASMGVTWGDFDRDGALDLYVSNMFSSAGERVTGQARFKPEAVAARRGQFRRHARGNALFRNAGDGTFVDVSEGADVTLGRWAWGALFLDANNDGLEDLYSPNGFVTEENTKDL